MLSVAALCLIGTTTPQPRIQVDLPESLGEDASGRLLVFVEPATPKNATADEVDMNDPTSGISVASRDVATFGKERAVAIDTDARAFPKGFTTLSPGLYRVQAVLDRDGNYNYGGRGEGDLVTRVVTVRFPLTSVQKLSFDHEVPPGPGQFDVTGRNPVAAQQILASRPHLHEEHIASRSLARFHGSDRSIAAWVLTPPGYDPNGRVTYPTVFTAGGFGANHELDGQQLSKQWHLMETGAIPPMIWVALDFSSPTGTTEFADSANNGPWGRALTTEVIPALEARYRMDAKPSGRFLTGHSSGGWFALWTLVEYPKMFGGSWPTSPDPADFHDFIGVDLYAPNANIYRDANGKARPLIREHGETIETIEEAAALETVLGRKGGQLSSFDWVFSPRLKSGEPAAMFDRATGAVNPTVVAYWRDHYDVAHRIETDWPRLRKDLDGKLHVTVGSADSFHLDGGVRGLEAAFRKVGGHGDFTYVPNANHAVSAVYERGGDRSALWKEMAKAMYAIARPEKGAVRK